MMKKKLLAVCLVLICSISLLNAQKLNVATYNIRNDNRGDSIAGNGWVQRCPVVCELIQFHDFDIFGSQEVLNNQLNDMLAGLPNFAYIGVGRDDGKTAGEYAPIFYKKDKFKLLKSGNFWLSKETTFPNKGWDAVLPRICTWGEFEDMTSGLRFWFFNLHMDHVGVEARKESAKLVLSKIKEMCGTEPVIFTGDFNVDQTNESFTLINSSGIMRDSYDATKICYAQNGTFNGFNTDRKTNSRIDHIFVSPTFDVLRYGILTDTYRSAVAESSEEIKSGNFPKEVSLHKYSARVPSDHFPVMVVLEYKK